MLFHLWEAEMLSFIIPELWHTPSTCPGTDRHQVGDNASQSPGKDGVTTRTAGMELRSQELQGKGQQ